MFLFSVKILEIRLFFPWIFRCLETRIKVDKTKKKHVLSDGLKNKSVSWTGKMLPSKTIIKHTLMESSYWFFLQLNWHSLQFAILFFRNRFSAYFYKLRFAMYFMIIPLGWLYTFAGAKCMSCSLLVSKLRIFSFVLYVGNNDNKLCILHITCLHTVNAWRAHTHKKPNQRKAGEWRIQ